MIYDEDLTKISNFEPLWNHHKELNSRMNQSFVFCWTRRFVSKCQLKTSSRFTLCQNTNQSQSSPAGPGDSFPSLDLQGELTRRLSVPCRSGRTSMRRKTSRLAFTSWNISLWKSNYGSFCGRASEVLRFQQGCELLLFRWHWIASDKNCVACASGSCCGRDFCQELDITFQVFASPQCITNERVLSAICKQNLHQKESAEGTSCGCQFATERFFSIEHSFVIE